MVSYFLYQIVKPPTLVKDTLSRNLV